MKTDFNSVLAEMTCKINELIAITHLAGVLAQDEQIDKKVSLMLANINASHLQGIYSYKDLHSACDNLQFLLGYTIQKFVESFPEEKQAVVRAMVEENGVSIEKVSK